MRRTLDRRWFLCSLTGLSIIALPLRGRAASVYGFPPCGFVVEIDYGRQVLTLHDPHAYHPSGSRTTFETHLFGSYDPQIDGAIVVPGRALIPVRFSVDTGAGGTIVSAPPVDQYALPAAVGKTYPAQDVGIGGAKPTEVIARLSAFEIGPYRIDGPVVALSRDTAGSLSNKNIGVNLGGSVLRRFTVIVDYARASLTLQPNGVLQRLLRV